LNTSAFQIHILSTINTFVDGHDDRLSMCCTYGLDKAVQFVPDLHAGLEIGPWFAGMADKITSGVLTWTARFLP
jgi:hypothetical protein